jgi:hypothetical protein
MLFGITLLVGNSINALAGLPRGGLRLAGDTGSAGTNPYGSATVFVRVAATATEKEDAITRLTELQQGYGFSWDGSVFQTQTSDPSGFDDFAARISLDRREIPALSREAGVVNVVSTGRSSF